MIPHLSVEEDMMYISCDGAVTKKLNDCLTHRTGAILTCSLSSWKNLPINIWHILELTTCTHNKTFIIFLIRTWMLCYICCAYAPSQTGQPHGLVTGWGQRAAGQGFLTQRTEPLWKRISRACCLKRLTSKNVFVEYVLLLLPGRYIQSRGSLGQGSTVHWPGLHCYRNSLSNKNRPI